MNHARYGADLDVPSNCGECRGGCCRRNMVLSLTPEEAEQLYDAGTDMQVLPQSEWRGNKPGRKRAFYKFLSDCGNLDQETFQCIDYENRPTECRDFKVGTVSCALAYERAESLPVDLPMPTFPQAG